MKKALITGVTGQDGAYLARLLLAKGYEVHGIKRRASSFNTARVDDIYEDLHNPDPRFFLHYGDLTDNLNVLRLLREIRPDEIYNLAAQELLRRGHATSAIMRAGGWKSVNVLARYLEEAEVNVWM